MKITGIIAEFNPFHNGHAYLLQEARRITHADLILVVMSGNYVQRGTPALLSKYVRTKMALLSGADLVIELPLFSAVASAEFFADGAIRLLTDLGASSFVFGCECTAFHSPDTLLNELNKIAVLLADEPEEFQAILKKQLTDGMSFPLARRHAVTAFLPAAAPLLDTPNTLLGIEYLKACYRRKSPITPQVILRRGSGYHDTLLPQPASSDTAPIFSSASALRAHLLAADTAPSALSRYMPEKTAALLAQEFNKSFPVTEDDFSSLLSYSLLMTSEKALCKYADISHSLAARISSVRGLPGSFSDLTEHIKTRNLTYTRVSRALLHLLLHIHASEQTAFHRSMHTPYARLLGMTPAAFPYLKQRNTLPVPLLQKLSEAPKLLTPEANSLFAKDLTAAELYRQVASAKFGTSLISEYAHEIILLE